MAIVSHRFTSTHALFQFFAASLDERFWFHTDGHGLFVPVYSRAQFSDPGACPQTGCLPAVLSFTTPYQNFKTLIYSFLRFYV